MTSESVRVALVLNGGVSLAVWMGGVSHELDRLRRSHPGDAETCSPAWTELCEAAGRHVIVDLVAGTSAGGLNGSLMAASIAGGTALPDLRALWEDKARLARRYLLRPEPRRHPDSVLDGDFFGRAITEQIDQMVQRVLPDETRDCGPGDDVTLLVTASALYGSSSAVRDMMGREFAAGDHRRVFRFRQRRGAYRWEEGGLASRPLCDFTAHRPELVLAARASAGFPFAFEPVKETQALRERHVGEAAGELTSLVDGGVLDNAPFGPLLSELRKRPRIDTGSRWIVYVVPGFGAPTPSRSTAWSELPGRLLDLSRESDLRDDVESLSRMRSESRAAAQSPECMVAGRAPMSDAQLVVAAEAQLRTYQHTRAAAILAACSDQPGGALVDEGGTLPEDVEALLKQDNPWIPAGLSPRRETGPDELTWQWGVSTARRLALWMSRNARGVACGDPLPRPTCALLADAEERLEALQVALDAVLESAGSRSGLLGTVAAKAAAAVGSGLLDRVGEEIDRAVEGWATARGLTSAEAWNRLLSAEVLVNGISWRTGDQPPAFSLLLVSPDSPDQGSLLGLDRATLGHSSWPSGKLYGKSFGHFGAFGAVGYRTWDWTWGRLDGALTLGAALLRGADVPAERRTTLLTALREEILAECDLTAGELAARTAEVVNLRPGQLVAQARDSGETQFEAIIDDLSAMAENIPLLTKPAAGGWSRKAKAKARGYLLRFGIRRAAGWAKRLVRAQSG